MMNRATEQKLERIVEALAEACGPDGKEVRARLTELVNFKPECAEYAPVKGMGIQKREMQQVPFFCETFLYGLLGKEDARTLLGRLRRLCDALGVDIEHLYKE
jgi:hypothetical protein